MLAKGRPFSKRNLGLDRAFGEANSTGVEKSATLKNETAPTRRSKAADEKEQRLAAALRANLRRRKAAMKSAD